jgi:general secretion pathway protein E
VISACPSLRITPETVGQARALCARQDVSVLQALQQLGGWPGDELMAALGQQFGYPVLSAAELQAMEPDFGLIAYVECAQRNLLVARRSGQAALLVLSDPFDGANEDWALRRCANERPHPQVALAHPDDLQACLVQQERMLRAMDGLQVGPTVDTDEEVAAVITLAGIDEEKSAVVKLVNSTIYDALKLRASDIHLECDAGCLHVMYRIDGVLVRITQVHGQEMAEQVISRIKVMAELDIAERRIPQDGRFKVRVNGRDVDFRVSVMPNIFGEDAVLRLLDRQSLTDAAQGLRLEDLGLDPHAVRAVRKLAGKPHGMLLVTGPTGSGKTTTLYAAITEIHTGRDKIVTIEDPVEYRLPRVLQIPVNEKKGLTFARGLRSILRHDPDKIMVGEIRDDETAQIAVQAALTGHLVFTTVHANNVFDVLGRFLHMGVDAYSFAAALNGIVAQRLLRINCPHCTQPVVPDPGQLEEVGLSAGEVADWRFLAGRGCGHCRGVGYQGRKAVAEVLVLDDAMRELIVTRAPISAVKERAAHAGMRVLRDTALRSVAAGETTLEEIIRVAG